MLLLTVLFVRADPSGAVAFTPGIVIITSSLHSWHASSWQVSGVPSQSVSQLLSVVVQFDHFFSEVHVCVPLQVLFAVQGLLLPSSVQGGPTTQLSS